LCQPALQYEYRRPLQEVLTEEKDKDVGGMGEQAERAVEAVGREGRKMPKFEVEYDALVIAVGAYSATFGIPGVRACSRSRVISKTERPA
jgi:NADH dehydrogenase FAD-containing subunit